MAVQVRQVPVSCVDVIVVGAGPVGLMLAAELALGGASVEVFEQRSEASDTVKAGSINIASAEILARRGLLDEARAAHRRTTERVATFFSQMTGGPYEAALKEARRRTPRAGHFAAIPLDGARLDLSDPAVAGHRIVEDATLVVQHDVERILALHADQLGVSVHRGIVVTGVTQDASGVSVASNMGARRATWVVGCDGGRSVVRKAAQFDFPGSDPEITGRQAQVDLFGLELLKPGWNWSERGVYRVGPTPGLLLTVEFEGPPEDRTSPLSAEEMESSIRRVSGQDVRIARMLGESWRWTDNARQVETYRDGRVFLAGDAAHVHSPFSGQGLNLGLGDATNLGWKLAASARGVAPPNLLDSYTAERRPVGAWVLNWTRAQVALMRPDLKVGELRGAVADLMATTDGMTRIVSLISGVTHRIELPGDHPWVGLTTPDLELADGHDGRSLFVGGAFVLLDGSSDGRFATAAAAWAGRIVCETGPWDCAGKRPLALLARPDGVVAWAVDDGDEDTGGLAESLHRWVGAPAP